MSKKETKLFDFTKVMIEESFGKFVECDVSKTLGNLIHQNTGDLGLDEIARRIYREGKSEIPENYVKVIVEILRIPDTNMVVAAKVATIDLLTKNKK